MSVDGLAGVWCDRLRRCESSDLTVGEFCEREEVGVSTYYYWKRKLEDAGGSVSAPLFVPARWKDSTRSGETGAEDRTSAGAIDVAGSMKEAIRLEASADARGRIDRSMRESIRVELPNGSVVRIAGDASAETIRSAVESAGRIGLSTEEAGC